MFLLHTLLTNIILLTLLYILVFQKSSTSNFKTCSIIPDHVLLIFIIMAAILMPATTLLHLALTWRHTHRRIIPKFPKEGHNHTDNSKNKWYVTRKVLIYISFVATLALTLALIAYSTAELAGEYLAIISQFTEIEN